DERRDSGEADVQLCRLDLRAGGVDRRLCGEIGLDVVIELTLCDRTLIRQRPIALQVALGLSELRLRFAELGSSPGQRRIERPRIDLEERLTGADDRALPVAAFHEIARHLRPDLRVDVA